MSLAGRERLAGTVRLAGAIWLPGAVRLAGAIGSARARRWLAFARGRPGPEVRPGRRRYRPALRPGPVGGRTMGGAATERGRPRGGVAVARVRRAERSKAVWDGAGRRARAGIGTSADTREGCLVRWLKADGGPAGKLVGQAGLVGCAAAVLALARSTLLRSGFLGLLAAAVALIVLHLHRLRSEPAYLVTAAGADPPSIANAPELSSLRRSWTISGRAANVARLRWATPASVSSSRLEAT